MSFGGAIVTFVSRTPTGTRDRFGMQTLTETTVTASGCRHRPMTFAETAEAQIDIATQTWKTTIPVGEYSASLRAAVLAIEADDVIRVNGVEFQIIGGIRHHPDMVGAPFKATIISQKQIG